MRRAALGISLVAGLAAPLAAQGTSDELLRQAQRYYEQVDVERALPLLRQLVSPGWPFEVTPEQRVEAYKYLGASLALTGKGDSAVVYFRAALERDAFTDLDPTRFTPAQLALFARARRLTFAIAARPVVAARFDPRTERLRFTVVTTHGATLEVRLRGLGGGDSGVSRAVLFNGTSQGLRDLNWNGLLEDGRLAPPGRYELVVVGRSALLDQMDSTRAYFAVSHQVEPLEDTLPALAARDFLPERRPASAATWDLVKGVGVAAIALAISDGLANGDLGGGMRSGSRTVAGIGIVTGGAAFFMGRRHRELPENIAINARRRAERQAANDAIVRRNTERVARTALVITPAAGVGP